MPILFFFQCFKKKEAAIREEVQATVQTHGGTELEEGPQHPVPEVVQVGCQSDRVDPLHKPWRSRPLSLKQSPNSFTWPTDTCKTWSSPWLYLTILLFPSSILNCSRVLTGASTLPPSDHHVEHTSPPHLHLTATYSFFTFCLNTISAKKLSLPWSRLGPLALFT